MAIITRITSTGKKRYLVRIDTIDPTTDRRKWVNVGTFGTRREAEKAFSHATTDRDKGTLLTPDSATVAEVMEQWLATKKSEITSNSYRDYESTVRLYINPALGSLKIQLLTAARLQAQYALWQKEGRSARTIRGCHMRLSQAFRQAVRFGIINSNPCDAVSPPRLGKSKADVWNVVEAVSFLRESESDALHPLWDLLLREGMRRGEALGLRWRDINFERGTAHISQTVVPDKSNRGRAMIQDWTKTSSSSRSVRLTSRTLEALKVHRIRQNEIRLALPDWQDNDLIVCTSRGTPVNPGNIIRSFDAIVKRAQLRRIRVHDLRHTSATLLLLAGTPAKVVSERLGHSSVGITMDLYSHVLPDMQDSAASAMDLILDRPAM